MADKEPLTALKADAAKKDETIYELESEKESI